MKFLILGLVALTTVGHVVCAFDGATHKWTPVPIDDSSVKAALDSTKAQIILYVIKAYPNITHDPIFHVNSVDKTFSTEFPTSGVYRINLTLGTFNSDPFNPDLLGQFTPIVTFTVYIVSQDFTSHKSYVVHSYDGIVLPHLSQQNVELKKPKFVAVPYRAAPPHLIPDHVGYKRIPSNDTGLWFAISALQDKIWARLEQNKILRPNATSKAADDFVADNFHVFYKETHNPSNSSIQRTYAVILTVSSTISKNRFDILIDNLKEPTRICVTLKVQQEFAIETFDLAKFQFVSNGLNDDRHLIDDDSPLPRLISAGPQTPAKNDDDALYGKPELVNVDSKHFWVVYKAVEKDVLEHLKLVFAKDGVIIPGAVLEGAIPQLKTGLVQYKNNHGDLDAPIVRKISAQLDYLGYPTLDSTTRKVINPSRILVNLLERFLPLNSTITYHLLDVSSLGQK